MRTRAWGVFTAVVLVLAATAPAPAMPPASRLARSLVRDARGVLGADPLTTEAIEIALRLAREASELDPELLEAWRLLDRIAVLGDRPEIVDEAVRRIVALDSGDETARLRRLNAVVDRQQGAAERVEVYRALIARAGEIGAPVAARLALDLALLERRRGDDAAFGRALAEAVRLDPGYRAAAALAAGYFRSRVDDPHAEAELLLNLVMADPADITAASELGRELVEHGAYVGASRMLAMATAPRVIGGVPPDDPHFADLAIAQWGAGDADAALATIAAQQMAVDDAHRAHVRRDRPGLTPLEIARVTGTLSTPLAAVRAVIHDRRGGAAQGSALEALERSLAADLEAAMGLDPPDPATVAAAHLHRAWMRLWLGGAPGEAEADIAAARALVPLTDVARDRFAGWLALRRDERGVARTLLAPLAEQDAAAALGMARLELASGRRIEAGQRLLDVARRQPGTLMGVWSSEHLLDLVGRRATISPLATRLEALLATLPRSFDRCLAEPRLCLALRVRAVSATVAPYAPIPIEIELTNNGRYPLSIDPEGPIRPQVALVVFLRMARARDVDRVGPIIVDIDRRLTLQPRDRVVVPVDLRMTAVGRLLDERPVQGALLTVQATANFVAGANAVVVPGPLGSATESDAIRVDGVRLSGDWIGRTMADLVGSDPSLDVTAFAALSHVAVMSRAEDLPPEQRQLLLDTVDAMAEGFPRLQPAAQAWLLGVIRRGPTSDPMLELARRSDERLVRLALLLHHVEGPDDPMLDVARRDERADVRRFAELTATFQTQRLGGAER